MKKWAGVCAAALAAVIASPGLAADTAAGAAAAAGHEAKIANIRKLVHVMSGKQMKAMMDKALQSSLQAVESQMPAEAKASPEMKQALDEYLRALSFTEQDLEAMLDLMVPVYDKYLDDADVAALVQFYESPAGRNFIRVMPELMTEAMPRIMAWQMERLKGPMETLRKKLEAIEEKKGKEPPAVGPNGG